MADSFVSDSFKQDAPVATDSFVSDSFKSDNPVPIVPSNINVNKAPPFDSTVTPPPDNRIDLQSKSTLQDSFVPDKSKGYDSSGKLEDSVLPAQLVAPSAQPGTTIFQPDIGDVLGLVRPGDREEARSIFQRDVRNQEDLNLLQGHLTAFGQAHGFPVSARFIEGALNPVSLANLAMMEMTLGSQAPLFRKMVRGEDISADVKAFFSGDPYSTISNIASAESVPLTPVEVNIRQELERKKSDILAQLVLPDDVSRATENDPTGVFQKRLALPGEMGGEFLKGDRITANDPMGVYPPKTYRVIPIQTTIPDSLIQDTSPEGLRDIILHQNVAAQALAEDIAKNPRIIPGRLPSEIASDNVIASVKDNTVDKVRQFTIDSADLALISDAKMSVQVETELFKDPQRVIDSLTQTPLNYFQVGKSQLYGTFTSSRDMARMMGPVGEELAKREAEAIVVSQARTGAASRVLNPFITEIEKDPILNKNYIEFLEGKSDPLNEVVRKAGIVTRAVMDQVGVEASQVNLKIFRTAEGITADWVPRLNYYPRMYDLEGMMGKKGITVREKYIQDIMESKGIERPQAIKLMDDFSSDSIRLFGALEKGRTTDLPGYSENIRPVLNSYFQGAFKRIELARQLGADNEIIGSMVNAVSDPYQKDTLDAVVQMMTGKTASGSVSNYVRGVENKWLKNTSKSFMPLSAIENAFQGFLGSFSKNGAEAWLMGFSRSFTAAGQQEAADAGALLEKYVSVFDRQIESGNFFSRTGFMQTEGANRTTVFLSEKYYMKGTLTKMLENNPNSPRLARELNYLGLNADKIISRGSFTEDELTKGALNSTALTQGRFDTPAGTIYSATPLGKIVNQLKAYDFLWWKFTKDYVLNEASNHNYIPLMRLVGASTFVVGEAQADIWSAITGKERPHDVVPRLMENFGFASGAGIMTDLLAALATGKKQGVAHFFTMPSEQVGQDAIDSTIDLRNGKVSTGAKFLAKRAIVPAITYAAGGISPWFGLSAGVASRAIIERAAKSAKDAGY